MALSCDFEINDSYGAYLCLKRVDFAKNAKVIMTNTIHVDPCDTPRVFALYLMVAMNGKQDIYKHDALM